MTMFETVKEKAAKIFGIQNTDYASFAKAATDLIEQNGGIPGLQAKFNAAGFGEIFQSWVSGDKKLPITTEQIEKVFGSENLSQIASKLGVPSEEISSKLAEYLPKLVENLNPVAHPEVNKM